MDLAMIATMTTLFVWATVLLLVDVFVIPASAKRTTGHLAMVGLAVSAGVALIVGTQGSPTPFPGIAPFDGMVVLDNMAVILSVIFLLAGLISIALSLDYLPRHGIERGEFYPLVMYATGGMLLLAQGADLILLFLGVELLSITLYILTAFAYPRLSSEEAAMKYLLLGAFAAGFFVYGIALMYGGAHTVNLAEVGTYVAQHPQESHTLLLVGGGLVLVALGFKIALVPFHMWTPDVYEGSPTPVTAFMSVGTKGAALAAMVRLLLVALPALEPFWMPILGVLAVLTMIVGNVGALTQSNVKRMLAYSSIGHAGYIVLGIMAASDHGIASFLFYLVAYTLTNLGAFAVLIVLEERGESAWSLDDFAGLWKRQGWLAVAMAVFMLSLAGMPPTAGFVGKFYIFTAAWESGLGWLVLVGLLTSAIAVFFYLRVVVRMFMQEPVREVQPMLPRGLAVSIGVALAGTLLFGLFPTLVGAWVQAPHLPQIADVVQVLP